jgi:hypothetical protein
MSPWIMFKKGADPVVSRGTVIIAAAAALKLQRLATFEGAPSQ